jgi:RepB DNA-primase from phage plasmid
LVEDRAGEATSGRSDTGAALAMLSAFASVGAKVFDLSITDSDGKPVKGLQRPGMSLGEMRGRITRVLQDAERHRHNVIIRPRSATALLIQLDDCDELKAEHIQPYSFLTFRTSPGNYQVWLAVADGPKECDEDAARQIRTRVRRGAGADQSATGATRIAGSINFKPQYAPAFPVVTITRTDAGRVTTAAALEQAGLIAPLEPPKPPASVPPLTSSRPGQKVTAGERPRHWPDYQRTLQGAPRKKDGTPDRSLADFMFCKWSIQRGHGIHETAAKLAEVSEKAQERIRLKEDQGYTLLTARNAAAAVERERGRHHSVKSTAGPG